MKPAFRFTILLSLLLHLMVFTPWLLTKQQPAPIKDNTSNTVELTLAPAIKPPEPTKQTKPPEPPDTPPPPRHLEDDITQSNTSDGLAETKGGSTQAPTQGRRDAQEETQTNDQVSETAPTPPSQRVNPNSPRLSDFLKAQKIAQKNMQKKGLDLQELTENNPANNSVESPLDQAEEEKARWYNEVLRRISKQVNFVWVKPAGLNSSTWGIIRLNIDEYGYLTDAWVHLPSGNAKLDRSAMRAVRQVYRYDIPKSQKLSRHYRHLEFRYRGGEHEES